MSRLFTFGCSYTSYVYPMWPWHLIDNYDEIYNFGRAGAGNDYIFHSIVDALKKHKIQQGDTVVIIWSSYYRYDYQNEAGGWLLSGGLFSNDLQDKTVRNLQKVWTLRSAVRKTWDYMNILAELFELKNIKFCFGSLYEMEKLSLTDGSDALELNLPNHVDDIIPSYVKLPYKKHKFCSLDFIRFQKIVPNDLGGGVRYALIHNAGRTADKDPHPNVLESYEFAKNIIAPALDIEFKGDRSKAEALHNAILLSPYLYCPVFNQLMNVLLFNSDNGPVPNRLDKDVREKYLDLVLHYDHNAR